MKKSNKTVKASVILLITFIILQLIINYLIMCKLFPIKHGNNYGFLSVKSGRVIVPLNKYDSRLKAYAMLPYEVFIMKYYDKKLTKTYSAESGKYGFKDDEGNIAIDYQYDEASDFEGDFAIVSIKKDGKNKFGTINKRGDWVIKPEYSHICSFKKYYTKACLDKNHCGVLDKFGNKITLMTYDTDHVKCESCDKIVRFCAIGSKNKNVNCNYFL